MCVLLPDEAAGGSKQADIVLCAASVSSTKHTDRPPSLSTLFTHAGEAWFHILKNSATFTEIPEDLDPRLKPVMEAARSKKLSGEDRIQYFRAMVSEEDKRDIAQAYLERGIEQGLEQGKVEERLDIARRMLSLGCEPEIIAQATTFSVEEIKSLI